MTGPIFTAGEWGSAGADGIADMPVFEEPELTRKPYSYSCQVQLTDSIFHYLESREAEEKGFNSYREFAIANIEMNESLQEIEDTKDLKWSFIKLYSQYDDGLGKNTFKQETSLSSAINVRGHNFSFGVYLERGFETESKKEVVRSYIQVKQEVGPELYAVAQEWGFGEIDGVSVEVQTKVSGLSWKSISKNTEVPYYLMRLVCKKAL